MSLRSFRERADLPLHKAAVLIGVYPSTIHRWEQGKTSPSVDNIPAIRDAYKLTDAEVLSLLEKEPA